MVGFASVCIESMRIGRLSCEDSVANTALTLAEQNKHKAVADLLVARCETVIPFKPA